MENTTVRHNPPIHFVAKTAEVYAFELIKFISRYKWIYSTQPIKYYVHDFWSQVPEFMRYDLLSLDEDTLIHLSECPYSQEIFPSFLDDFTSGLHKLVMPCSLPNEDNIISPSNQLLKLGREFSTGMKAKKQHEVEYFATLVNTVNENYLKITILDVGAGKGWLGQVLEHVYGFDVISLEGNPSHNERAVELSVEVQKRLHSKNRAREVMEIFVQKKAFTAHFFLDFKCDIQQFDFTIKKTQKDLIKENIEYIEKKSKLKTNQISDEDLNSQMNTDQPNTTETEPIIPDICMVCLHGCGDLSPSVLHVFSRWDRAKTLVNVGCCYQRMSYSEIRKQQNTVINKNLFKFDPTAALIPNGAKSEQAVFPMSKTLQKILDIQSNDVDVGRLQGFLDLATKCGFSIGEDLNHKVDSLFYRSIMEIVLDDFFTPRGMTYHIRKMKSIKKVADHETYLFNALDKNLRICTHPNPPGGEEIWNKPDEVLENYPQISAQFKQRFRELRQLKIHTRHQFSIWFSLECALSRVVESIVILDRFLFLEECGNIIPTIIPVFDKRKSPRNFAIIASKC